MIISLNKTRAQQIIKHRRISFSDLPYINFSHITIEDMKIAKKLFSRYIETQIRTPT